VETLFEHAEWMEWLRIVTICRHLRKYIASVEGECNRFPQIRTSVFTFWVLLSEVFRPNK
jgi:hypothetical protein